MGAYNPDHGAQTRRGSFTEALANIIVGFIVAIAVQRLAYPFFGIRTTYGEDGLLALIFTLASLGRSYALRRLFNHLDALGERDRQKRAHRLASRLSTAGLPLRSSGKQA